MGKSARSAEPASHAALYRSIGVPILGEIRPPGTAEGGDLLWLDPRTLLAGRGYRTNEDGIGQLRDLLAPSGAEVIEAPLPHGAGPGSCLHIMSLVSMLDDRTALVDLTWLSVATVELLRRRIPRLIDIEPEERRTQACNVLSLGTGRLVAIEDNRRTNDRLRQAGFEVRTIRAREIALNGGGGPTCLTRPFLRGDAA
jgi:N-dimethylarginine dimethylaminohydrolase